MKHLLEISQLPADTILKLAQRALAFKDLRADYPRFSGARLANLFYENSTRTRISFELAADHLSIPVINFVQGLSSENKGELIEDTVRTLAAMGINLFVIRHSENRMQEALAKRLSDEEDIHIINAGDGTHAHPSQALLDLMTILEVKGSLSGLKIAIVGNLRHSRVANSLQCLFESLGLEQLYLVAPEIWWPQNHHFGKLTTSLREGIEDADVVIALRVQKERLSEDSSLDLATYHQNYAISLDSLAIAKKDAMVMHPGPVNRGIEIDSAVVDGPQSFILQQVRNGVFMRMAMIEYLLS